MPDQETAYLNQYAVVWTATGNYDNNGAPIVNKPKQIMVRWETGRIEGVDAQGNVIASDAELMVSCVIPVESILWLGKMQHLPSPTKNLMRVTAFEEIPDVKDTAKQRSVTLKRWMNALPTVSS